MLKRTADKHDAPLLVTGAATKGTTKALLSANITDFSTTLAAYTVSEVDGINGVKALSAQRVGNTFYFAEPNDITVYDLQGRMLKQATMLLPSASATEPRHLYPFKWKEYAESSKNEFLKTNTFPYYQNPPFPAHSGMAGLFLPTARIQSRQQPKGITLYLFEASFRNSPIPQIMPTNINIPKAEIKINQPHK